MHNSHYGWDVIRHAEFISASLAILKWFDFAHHLFEPEPQSRRPEPVEGQVQNDIYNPVTIVIMKKIKVIDITMWMGDWTYPGDKPFTISEPYSAFGKDKEFCYKFCTNSADGTHIQSPHYMLKNGKKINDFDINCFRKEAIVIDLRQVRGEMIPSNLLRKELDNEELNGKAIIFRTGVMDRLIKGENVKDKLLSVADAKYLIDKGVKMIVTDSTCLDDPTKTGGICKTTTLCCKNEVILVKQTCNLNKISKRYVIVEAYPLKIRGISGTPCRAVVIDS